jgi:dihydrofolate reductase/dihydrofolate reductase (trimethoprim resistance protein)
MPKTHPKISLVAAMAKNRVIGNGLNIPWKIKGEQLRFKELTTGKVMVMGRLTHQSIGRPLPNRTNVILTRDSNFKSEGCEVFTSMKSILDHYQSEEEIMIAGGGQLYADTIHQADNIHLTIIDKEIEGDIFFPEFDKNLFEIVTQEKVDAEIPYTYYNFKRIKSKEIK